MSLGLLMGACSPYIKTTVSHYYPPLGPDKTITVFEPGDSLKGPYKDLGTVFVGDNGFTVNCQYDRMLGVAMEEARKSGGDALYITGHFYPSIFGSSCHRISARILRLDSAFASDTAQQPLVVPQIKVKDNDFPRFRFAVNGGWSYIISTTDDYNDKILRDYYKDFKSGYHYGGEAEYFISKAIGFGVEYLRFNTATDKIGIHATYNDGSEEYGYMKDNVTTDYVGLSFLVRHLSRSRKHTIIMLLSYGYTRYNDDFIFIDHYKLTGETVGSHMSLGYDYSLSENLSLGLSASLFEGFLTSYTLDDGSVKVKKKLNSDNYLGFNHFDLAFGIRYNIFTKKRDKTGKTTD